MFIPGCNKTTISAIEIKSFIRCTLINSTDGQAMPGSFHLHQRPDKTGFRNKQDYDIG